MDLTLEEKFKKIAESTAKSLKMEKLMEEGDRRVDAEIRQLRIENKTDVREMVRRAIHR